MIGRYQQYSSLYAVLVYLAMIIPAQASGDYRACNPAHYNADECLKAHNKAARAQNKSLDLMDLADHAIAAGDKVAAFGHWSLAATSDKNRVAMYRLGAAFYNGDGAPQSDKEAAKWFRQSADHNYAAAQYMMGVLYAYGQGVEQSTTDAVKWYQKAADQKQVDALFALGDLYYTGNGIAKDLTRAAKLWRTAAEAGHLSSQVNYGWVLFTGEGVEKNYEQAEFWTRKGADAGNAIAKTNLGEMYEYGRGVPVDLALAEKWYREAAAEGVKEAEDGLVRISAIHEKKSDGLPPHQQAMQAAGKGDIDSAVRILTEAAEAGDFDSQAILGLQYAGASEVILVNQDYELAHNWMRKAAAQKQKAAAIKLDEKLMTVAAAFQKGALAPVDIVSLFDGVQADKEDAKNYSEAVKWFEMAGELGNADALIAIGDLYGEGGHGISQDFAKALKYYKRAAAKKSTPLLAHRIGSHYAKGLGVAKNEQTAAQWFEKSASEYPEAELWLAQYWLGRNQLRSAMHWLDRAYLTAPDNEALAKTYDATLHKFYATLLPPAPAGWTAGDIKHETVIEPVKAAHFSSSDIVFPIGFQRSYRQSGSGKQILVRVFLNSFEFVARTQKNLADARRYQENAEIQYANTNDETFNELAKLSGNMSARFGAYEGFITTIKAKGANEALIEIPLNSHILVCAETVKGNADNVDEVESLKTILRATDLDLIKSAADGHGVYKKNKYGNVYKP